MPNAGLWDKIYMNLAAAVALQGTCPRALVGAVLVRNGRPLSVGYNGAPPGMPHCQHDGYEVLSKTFSCTNAVHAELNAIAYAARRGIPTDGATLYCTHRPCVACGQAIVSAGIVAVYWSHDYSAPFEFPESIPSRQFCLN